MYTLHVPGVDGKKISSPISIAVRSAWDGWQQSVKSCALPSLRELFQFIEFKNMPEMDGGNYSSAKYFITLVYLVV